MPQLRTARCLLAGALLGYAAVILSEPWAGEDWPDPDRDPEQGSQPDHEVPRPSPSWPPWRRRLNAGPVTQACPKCGSTDLRYDNSLGFWCRGHDEAFTAPMNLETAVICYAGFFDVRRAA